MDFSFQNGIGNMLSGTYIVGDLSCFFLFLIDVCRENSVDNH